MELKKPFQNFKNTGDESTVVRWSAAFASTEIAKSNKGAQEELISELRRFRKRKQQRGEKRSLKISKGC